MLSRLVISRIQRVAMLSLMALPVQHAIALPSDAKQPVKLVADSASFNEKTGNMQYRGNVNISQGSLNISANTLTIQLDSDKSIKTASAVGSPAVMQQQLKVGSSLSRGQAREIRYDAKTGIITLLGNASLKQAGASIKGNTIRYSLKAGDFEAKGTTSGGTKKQIELVIPPNPNSKRLSIR